MRNTKISPEQAYAIWMDTRRPLKQIAYDYGVSISTIHQIKTGRGHRKSIRTILDRIAKDREAYEAAQKRKAETNKNAQG